MSQDDPDQPEHPYLQVSRRLLELSSEAQDPTARQQFVLLAAMYQSLARSSRAVAWAPPPVDMGGQARYSSWQGSFLRYRRDTVLSNVPSAAGVYALWSASRWIYVGESGDVRRRLLAHLDDNDECIVRHEPVGFGFEFIEAPDQRQSRLQVLIRELLPLCNPSTG